MGASILAETMAAVHCGKHQTKRFHATYLAAQAYSRARCSKGAYFAFDGKSPAQPSWVPIYGVEGEAMAAPASAGPTELVFYARPGGAVQSGKFGNTKVSLPRAPVSKELVEELRSSERAIAGTGRFERAVGPENQFLAPTVEQGIPALELSIPRRLSIHPDVLERVAASDAPRSLPRRSAGVEGDYVVRKKRAPRQTSKYWHDERQKHALTIFDGDD